MLLFHINFLLFIVSNLIFIRDKTFFGMYFGLSLITIGFALICIEIIFSVFDGFEFRRMFSGGLSTKTVLSND